MQIYNYFLEKFGKLNSSEKRLLRHIESPHFHYENIKELLKNADLSVSSLYNFLDKNNMQSYKEFYGFIRSIGDYAIENNIYEKSHIYKKYLQIIGNEYSEWIGSQLIEVTKAIHEHQELIIFSDDEIISKIMSTEMRKIKKMVWRFTNLEEMLLLIAKCEKPLIIFINAKDDKFLHEKAQKLAIRFDFVYLGFKNLIKSYFLKLLKKPHEMISPLHSIVFLTDLIRHAYQYLINPHHPQELANFTFYQKIIAQK